MHLLEKPIALQTTQTANLNRDAKKRRQPFTMEDFYLYQPRDVQNLPSARYGAAAIALVESGEYPAFALFCFPELRRNAGENVPTIIAYTHPSAILLAPTVTEGGMHGLLIAEHAVSAQMIHMKNADGQEIMVQMPIIKEEVMAEEDIILPVY